MKRYFVTGIGTGVGKTVISAILTEKLQADYWKPIQSGDLDDSDTLKVKELVSNPTSKFHEETYRLSQPMSPHAAAKIDGVEIKLKNIHLPVTQNHLIIEGAGGLMVPLNDTDLMVDLAQRLQAEIILVSMNYLGSINHTLMSVELLKTKGIPIAGIIFNGENAIESMEFILNYTGLSAIGYIPMTEKVDRDFIMTQALNIKLPA